MAYADLDSIFTPASGTAVTAAVWNQLHDNLDYLFERGPYICTAGTRPGSPFQGQVIYETDTGYLLQYYGATTGWMPPWRTPWGLYGAAEGTTAQTGISAITDLTSMSLTWTAVANRRYHITGQVRANKDTNVGAVTLTLRTSGGTVLQEDTAALDVTNITIAGLHIDKMWTPSAGSQTVKLSLSATSANASTTCASTRPLTLEVVDVGAVGTPPSP